ncbi:MAG: replication initiation protein [Candidatus Amoebophilus sp.]
MENKVFREDSPVKIKQHNAITEARYEMTALQKNILYLLLSQLRDDDSSINKYSLSIQELKRIRNLRVNREEFLQSARGLITSGLTIYNEEQDKFVTIGILASAEYDVTNSKGNLLIIEFDKRLHPFLYNVKSRFTTFTLEKALNLKSKYSKRIYEMLSQFKDTGIFRISVRSLKTRLGLIDEKMGKEEYIKFGLFNTYVLEVARKEINEQTDISFSFVTKKTGKKITDLEFYITYKLNNQAQKESVLKLDIPKAASQAKQECDNFSSKKKDDYKKLPPELFPLYKRLRELALDKRLATLVVKNIPTKELELEINDFYNSVTQRKNKTTITPHFQDLLYRYAGIRVRQNYKKVGPILKKESTDMPLEERKSNSVKDIDSVYTFCFNTLRSFGINYADIQLLLTQASVDEVKNFLEEICKELEKNKEPDKATYVINKFYTVFGSTNTKLTKQEKVQTSSEKLKNMLYRKHENLNNEGK